MQNALSSAVRAARAVRRAPIVRLRARRTAIPAGRSRQLLGDILLGRGAVDPGDLAKALALQAREDVQLGEILLSHGMVSEAELYAALAEQHSARIVDLKAEAPDPRLIDALGADLCVRHRILPWRRIGGATVIVTARPEDFRRREEELPAGLKPALMAVAPERDLLDALVELRSCQLTRRAEARTASAESCRAWDGRRFRRYALGVLAGLAAAGLAAPVATFAGLAVLALAVMTANMGLRLGALFAAAERRRDARRPAPEATPSPVIARLPVVSILVPLYRETAIAERLLVRLARLSYPRELLDICLVTEDNDATTAATIAATRLPRWLRVVTVPRGTLRTKPRALNYALDFCRGSIVGIYDAEDAPAPDQIHKVVARFHARGPEVACLQGVLDYYNARSNWMARCFALEYAAWFRVVLPGIQRMGFAIPLGGTTLFFRRAALEALGGWDAHNVTEDADLGMRLARRGYRAELVETVTEEEANARAWPWVKQRSRWIKGYAMTWAVHMRQPRQSWAQLGARRFLGMQLLFGGSLLSSVLAPVLWSFWLLALGLPHPLSGAVPLAAAWIAGGLLAAAFAVNLAVFAVAVSGPKHRHLLPWALSLDLYFPLATLAAGKALLEMVARPFYWDKTSHGIDDAAADASPEEGAGGEAPEARPAIRAEPPADRPALAPAIGGDWSGDWAASRAPEAPANRA